jgi:protein-ribulosamine 3-kinase
LLPLPLFQHINALKGITIAHDRPINGGDINRAALLTCKDGRQLFIKYNKGERATDMLRTELLGLTLLGASKVIGVPKTLGHDEAPDGWAYLLMEYVVSGHKSRFFWADFGRALATMHSSTAERFGFGHDNYIGTLPQSNTRHDSWADFYTEERLIPQVRMAMGKGAFGPNELKQMENLGKKLNEICPKEAPALIHGDLWGGNFLCNEASKPILIDPSACYAHREMDMAMTRLFGGFEPLFYNHYQEAYPLEPGFEDRMQIYQLYYILVHFNIFGGDYAQQAKQILKQF